MSPEQLDINRSHVARYHCHDKRAYFLFDRRFEGEVVRVQFSAVAFYQTHPDSCKHALNILLILPTGEEHWIRKEGEFDLLPKDPADWTEEKLVSLANPGQRLEAETPTEPWLGGLEPAYAWCEGEGRRGSRVVPIPGAAERNARRQAVASRRELRAMLDGTIPFPSEGK